MHLIITSDQVHYFVVDDIRHEPQYIFVFVFAFRVSQRKIIGLRRCTTHNDLADAVEYGLRKACNQVSALTEMSQRILMISMAVSR